jgi:methylated-DNA-[protein]-cysteine S-methyltransferase
MSLRPGALISTRLRVASFETAAGPMLAAFSDRGLAGLERGDDLGAFTAVLERRFGSRRSFASAAWRDGSASGLARQLNEYFAGKRRRFDVALDLDDLAGFNRRTLLAAREIPYGETTTYGELAAQLGHPGAARAVGNALSRCPISVIVPCHRVVRAADGLSGWGPNLREKQRLLALERQAIAASPVPTRD